MTLRILMTADTVGGVWTYACELVTALAKHDVEVTLATMGAPPSPAQARTIAALPNAELLASKYALEWMTSPWRDVDAAGDWLLELASARRCDLVHLNGYTHATLPFEVPVLVAAHSCVVTWYRAVHGADAPPEWNEYRRRVRAGLCAASAIVAPTRAILDAISSAYDVDGARGHVILNGRDAAGWRSAATKEPFVLAAGRLWDEAKGLADLEACASRVSWPIHVAGPTTGPGGIDAVTANGVRMLGELKPDALADWMGRASIYALPARYEPFGLSVLEAALSGAALVLGGIDTLREVWGETALYVPPRDPDALALALEALANDPLRCHALAAASRARALQLTPVRMAAAYHALYLELVSSAPADRPDGGAASDAEVCA